MIRNGDSALTRSRIRHRAERQTQQELAQLFGVSRARIYQIERSALAKLRRAIVSEARRAGMTVETWLGEDS
jgi:DNA-directed RNA polymerase sigma subunit (sigma70/sigma32)